MPVLIEISSMLGLGNQLVEESGISFTDSLVQRGLQGSKEGIHGDSVVVLL